jgi:quercetin dioxygenase-like cupin family protein
VLGKLQLILSIQQFINDYIIERKERMQLCPLNFIMAFKGKEIKNPVSGQTIRFINTSVDTDGSLLEMESIFAPHSKEPVPHYHPYQKEMFTVLEGKIRIRLKGKERELKQGEVLHMKPNMIHSMWNPFDTPARVHWAVQPAFGTEYFLETGMGLASDGKVGKNGMPKLLQTVLLLDRFKREFRLGKPSYRVQKILLKSLSPIARAAGYKAVYDKYID